MIILVGAVSVQKDVLEKQEKYVRKTIKHTKYKILGGKMRAIEFIGVDRYLILDDSKSSFGKGAKCICGRKRQKTYVHKK